MLATSQSAVRELPVSKSRRGALQVYESLREDILWLRLEPGSALDEVALASRFEVSRTPVREALLLLSGEGFVKFLLNRTTIVAPFTMDNAGAYFDTLLLLSRAVARSAALAGRTDSSVLSEIIGEFLAAVNERRNDAALSADLAFQRHLSQMAGNGFQARCFDQILDAGMRLRILHYFPNATDADLIDAHADMQCLARAVAERDADSSDACAVRSILKVIDVTMRSAMPGMGADMKIFTFEEIRNSRND